MWTVCGPISVKAQSLLQLYSTLGQRFDSHYSEQHHKYDDKSQKK